MKVEAIPECKAAEEKEQAAYVVQQAKQHPTLSSLPLLNITIYVTLPTTCSHLTCKKCNVCEKMLRSCLSFDISKVSHSNRQGADGGDISV